MSTILYSMRKDGDVGLAYLLKRSTGVWRPSNACITPPPACLQCIYLTDVTDYD